MLVGLGKLGAERPDVASVDLNPLIVRDGKPVAVDALVEIAQGELQAKRAARPQPEPREPERSEAIRSRFAPLFHPRGIVVAGVSSHPGKFGFVALHNLLRFGYAGRALPGQPRGRRGARRSRRCATSREVPEGAADLVFVCTPAHANGELLRACAQRGVRAAFIASAGYGEAGDEGRQRRGRAGRGSRTSSACCSPARTGRA